MLGLVWTWFSQATRSKVKITNNFTRDSASKITSNFTSKITSKITSDFTSKITSKITSNFTSKIEINVNSGGQECPPYIILWLQFHEAGYFVSGVVLQDVGAAAGNKIEHQVVRID